MPLQTQRLMMVGLGIQGDLPPNPLQPPLPDGIHLRWAFQREQGFPWYGYYLFRRDHRPGRLAPARMSTLADLELGGAPYRRCDLAEPARRVQIRFDFHAAGRVAVAALLWETPVDETVVDAGAGESRTVTLEYDTITAIRFSLDTALPAELLSVTVAAEARVGWHVVPGFPYPFRLPVSHRDYPCTAGRPEDLGHARAVATERIHYGDPSRLTSPDPSGYTAGTASVTNGSFAVRGRATRWRDSMVGAILQVEGDPTAYTIMRVLSPEHLVLSRAYAGASRAGTRYLIQRDPFGQLHDHLVQLVAGGPVLGQPMACRLLPRTIHTLGTVELDDGSPVVRGVGTAWSNVVTGLDFQVLGCEAGTISVVHGFTIVSGTGTPWSPEMAGMTLRVAGDPTSYTIAIVESPTRLVLDRPYGGASGDGLSYTSVEPSLYPIERVASPTELRLARPYHGPARPGAVRYAIVSALQSPGESRPPRMPVQSPLDMVLLASLHPAMAQVLGLYWVDALAEGDQAYDYMILADHEGRFHCDAREALTWLEQSSGPGDFTEVDGYIVFNKRRAAAPALSPPGDPRSYALPASAGAPAAPNSAGLSWALGAVGGVLLPDRAVMAHIWRADLGSEQPAEPPTVNRYLPTTVRKGREHPVVVSAPFPGRVPQRPPDWPPFALDAIERDLGDGWYSYRVSGIDIFGRHSQLSEPARWYQWEPAPEPRPWYYQEPPGTRAIHPFAVHLLDNLPPPPPVGIEAHALDPADPTVVQDAAYQAWRGALAPEDRDTLVGLRVRWLWTQEHMRQAPDTREFRIYYQPGRLNVRLGRITGVSPAGDEQSVVETDIANRLPPDAYLGMRLQQASRFFKVLSSEAGSPLRLRVQNVGPAREVRPRSGAPCSLALSPAHPEHTDYTSALSWQRRIAVVGYHEHVKERIPPMLDGNGYPLTGSSATVHGSTVSLNAEVDLSKVRASNAVLYLDQPGEARAKYFRIVAIDNIVKTVRVDGLPRPGEGPALWVIGPPEPLRVYEIFLSAPDTAEGGGLAPSLAEPIVYAHIGVSAADSRPHTADDPQWREEDRGGWTPEQRYGNEGPVTPPFSIFRVLRQRPAPPVPPPADSDRVYATAADYHGHSFYAFRWQPAEHLKAHIVRALDDSVFKVDWARRERDSEALSAADEQRFPPERRGDAPEAVQRREAVAAELNQLSDFEHDEAGRGLALACYRQLSNDALRVLAGLSGNERAFAQITIQPLDPDDPSTEDRRCASDPEGYTPSADLRVYEDTLPGRSSSRYLYRALYVDGAQNRSDLSLASPPVYLPKVAPPRSPVITKVLGGDRQIVLRWAVNREPDLAEYRVYRAENREAAGDLRRMELVHVEEAGRDGGAGPISWADEVPNLRAWYYRVVAVDAVGNVSPPTKLVTARAYDLSPPAPPEWRRAERVRLDLFGNESPWDAELEVSTPAAALEWVTTRPDLKCVVQRRPADREVWSAASPWLSAPAPTEDGRWAWAFRDATIDEDAAYIYRVRLVGRAASTYSQERPM